MRSTKTSTPPSNSSWLLGDPDAHGCCVINGKDLISDWTVSDGLLYYIVFNILTKCIVHYTYHVKCHGTKQIYNFTETWSKDVFLVQIMKTFFQLFGFSSNSHQAPEWLLYCAFFKLNIDRSLALHTCKKNGGWTSPSPDTASTPHPMTKDASAWNCARRQIAWVTSLTDQPHFSSFCNTKNILLLMVVWEWEMAEQEDWEEWREQEDENSEAK